MTKRIKLIEDDFQIRYVSLASRKILINSNAAWHLESEKHQKFSEKTEKREEQRRKDTIQQILDDHEKVNRLNHIFTLHRKDGAPTNKPELTGVDQGVIDQIQNIITGVLQYIQDGETPDGYSNIKDGDYFKEKE